LSRLEHFCCPRSIESVASLAVFSRYQVQLGNACREALLRDVEIYLVPMRQRGNEKNLATSLKVELGNEPQSLNITTFYIQHTLHKYADSDR